MLLEKQCVKRFIEEHVPNEQARELLGYVLGRMLDAANEELQTGMPSRVYATTLVHLHYAAKFQGAVQEQRAEREADRRRIE